MTQPIRLYGTPLSNYYNKVKIALLEQNRPFEEVLIRPADRWPDGSPTGKVPYLETPDGHLVFESQAIVEYLEETREQAPSLYPVNTIERARCRELTSYLELYLELPARRLYGAAFWGAKLAPGLAEEVIADVSHGLVFLARRADFLPWLCGNDFTHADAAAWAHFATMQRALQFVGAASLLHDALPPLAGYLEKLVTRPSIQRTQADLRVEFRQRFGKASPA
ncbi:glutathione S-transferase family protein [Pusillimonas minor]|uniref:Glutathione S-transferase family protein n=1 Tax=Pusillimonas minor TaxID=2697024 RepID=A0A842HL09_9BURK|nr:glutathione S-transferase family protein [Pusillimonas minor]MBC2768966.1 glutathione S-transferase family protein [Pusillimonas minor]